MADVFSSPKVGTRFDLYGSVFEIQFVSRGVIRYAADAGGAQHRINLSQFYEMVKNEVVRITFSPHSYTISADYSPAVVRKYRYISAVQQDLKHPTSPKLLADLIVRVSREINDPVPPGNRTVIEWLTAYKNSGDAGLVPKVCKRGNRFLRFDPEVERLISSAIEEVYLKPEHTDAQDVRSYVVGKLVEAGLCTKDKSQVLLPSLRSIQRRLKCLDPYVVTRARKGEIAANRVAKAAGRKIFAAAPLNTVEMDTHKLDIIVIDPENGKVLGRPYLTSIIDVCTRAVVGMHISMYPPSAITALAALKDMISRPTRSCPGGVPSIMVPDNGTEFKNSAFARVCEKLSITISPAQIRDPNGKARKERFYLTLTRGIIQKIPGTTFSNPNERGEYNSSKNARISLNELVSLMEEWVEQVYMKTVHTGTGRAPLAHWSQLSEVIPPLSLSVADIDALARRPMLRTIQGGRVSINNIEYFSHALATIESQSSAQVTVLVNDLNLHTVLIEHPVEKNVLILAESTDPNYTVDLDCFMHAEAQKIKKEWTKADIRLFGANSNCIARAKLLELIHEESLSGKRRISKLTNGQGMSAMEADLPKKAPISEKKSLRIKKLPQVAVSIQSALPSNLGYSSFDIE